MTSLPLSPSSYLPLSSLHEHTHIPLSFSNTQHTHVQAHTYQHTLSPTDTDRLIEREEKNRFRCLSEHWVQLLQRVGDRHPINVANKAARASFLTGVVIPKTSFDVCCEKKHFDQIVAVWKPLGLDPSPVREDWTIGNWSSRHYKNCLNRELLHSRLITEQIRLLGKLSRPRRSRVLDNFFEIW